jgi:hypothetical protein
MIRLVLAWGLLIVVGNAEAGGDEEEAMARKVAVAFAASHFLGTGTDQFLTSIRLTGPSTAVAIIGDEGLDDTEIPEDKNAYTVNLKKGKKGWQVVSIEYVFKPTGKKKLEKVKPPFPDSYWDKHKP